MRLRYLVVSILLIAGCPDLHSGAAVSEKCVKQYDKCKLPAGPLGVCDLIPCANGQTDPCFKCMPQH